MDPILASELLPDRAISSFDEDLLGVSDLVAELKGLCLIAPVPSNIGLFGAWGSGKSGVVNLLELKLKEIDEIRVARFDASKYAEVPLRRHFLSQVAKSLEISDSKYSEGLYRSEGRTSLELRSLKDSWWVILLGLTAVLGFLGAISLIVASFGDKSLGSDFGRTFEAGLSEALLSAPFVVAFVAALSKRLTLDSKQDAPTSAEQFEKLFQNLIEDVTASTSVTRIVIIIDELDRCPPSEVVDVLETIRTFLNISPCIFVVVADQQVLEGALSKVKPHAATLDTANPYYSTTAAYLDKMFHYQLHIPRPLPRTLTGYALALIETKPGVWKQIPNPAHLVSVLIPTHVWSPRRVKVLLNNFLVAFRIAIRRTASGILPSEIESRVGELAKLTCLRTEFPLFAVDLETDHRVAQAALWFWQNPTRDETELEIVGMDQASLERSKLYAHGFLHAASFTVLGQPTTSDLTHDAGDRDEPLDSEKESALSHVHSSQLMRYLDRTARITDPQADLIHLESVGSAVGLEAELALRLERAAVDGQTEEVLDLLGRADSKTVTAEFRLLARLLRDSLGLEPDNVFACLKVALLTVDVPERFAADEILAALTSYIRENDLAVTDVRILFQIADRLSSIE